MHHEEFFCPKVVVANTCIRKRALPVLYSAQRPFQYFIAHRCTISTARFPNPTAEGSAPVMFDSRVHAADTRSMGEYPKHHRQQIPQREYNFWFRVQSVHRLAGSDYSSRFPVCANLADEQAA
eukprot:3826203-Pyramimonas_sp.AAC.1